MFGLARHWSSLSTELHSLMYFINISLLLLPKLSRPSPPHLSFPSNLFLFDYIGVILASCRLCGWVSAEGTVGGEVKE